MHIHYYSTDNQITLHRRRNLKDLLDLFLDTKAGLDILRLLGRQEHHRGVHIMMTHKLPHSRKAVVLNLMSTNLSIFTARNIVNGKSIRGHPRHMVFNTHHILPSGNLRKAHLPPVFSPAIPNDPVILAGLFVLAKADDGDNVIGLGGGGIIVEDATFVISQGSGVDGGGDWSPCVNLRLDLVRPLFLGVEHAEEVVTDFAVFCHCGIGKVVQLDAFPTAIREA
mmetsp:Transcript_8339/g.15109  ORF Transcript_8339/g.15109 Transcript_8339/m.15109 type:complete len:224 (-) Transcript_8339:193-864(-)